MNKMHFVTLATLLGMGVATGAHATFHFMQIEQVIGGVNGDTTAQAVQLRMRAGGQNLMGGAKLWVHDATGSNPILLIDFLTNVPNGVSGSRVLISSPSFKTQTTPTKCQYMAHKRTGRWRAAV